MANTGDEALAWVAIAIGAAILASMACCIAKKALACAKLTVGALLLVVGIVGVTQSGGSPTTVLEGMKASVPGFITQNNPTFQLGARQQWRGP